MSGFLNDMTGLEKFFAACAFIGGILLIFRLLMQFLGGHSDVGDVDSDGVSDFHAADSHGADSDLSFKLLSFQGLTAFFLMFGLVGLALLRQSQVASTWAILGGTIAGLISVWIMRVLYRSLSKLQASGNIDIQNAVGQEGSVYLNIPPGGAGQVQISVQDHLKIYDAVADDNQEIKTGTSIRVVRIQGGNTLVVEKLSITPFI